MRQGVDFGFRGNSAQQYSPRCDVFVVKSQSILEEDGKGGVRMSGCRRCTPVCVEFCNRIREVGGRMWWIESRDPRTSIVEKYW